MLEPTRSETSRMGVSVERSREEILAAAQTLPPYENMVIDDLTEDESRRFMEIILDL